MNGMNGLATVGGGPWRVLPECLAPTHNTGRAAKGQGFAGRPRAKCVCPRGQDVYAVAAARQREREKERMKRIHRATKDPAVRLHPMNPEPTKRRSPNFYEGLCRLPENLTVAEQGMNDQPTRAGIAARALAKELCGRCPLVRECRAWVVGQESPPGSWGGVWGGLDPWNRKGLELVIGDGRAKVIPYAVVD